MPSETPPTRIAFCITDLDAGGAERALVQIVTRLDRRRWEPHVFCLDAGGVLVVELRSAGIDVVCLGAHRPRDFLVVWPLYRRLAALRPAILQTFLFHANIVGRLAGAAARVPAIVSGIRVAEKRSRTRLWIDRITDRLVTAHVCVSRDVAEFSTNPGGLPRAKIRVIPNGVDYERFANAAPTDLTQFGVPRGSRVLLFVGRLDPQKGPLQLLEAAAELFADHADLHLMMVGDGPLASELREWTRARNLQSRIHFAGRQENIAGLMRAADLFVLPSQWEGLPNVVLGGDGRRHSRRGHRGGRRWRFARGRAIGSRCPTGWGTTIARGDSQCVSRKRIEARDRCEGARHCPGQVYVAAGSR